MKISVIMPIYNCQSYLDDAIASVFRAGVEDIELIAVEDHSTDDTRARLEELANREGRIRPIYNERNMGVAASRNIALGVAEGEYIAFCDADDTVPEGSYKLMLDAIGDADVLIGGFADLSDGGMERICSIDKKQRSSLWHALFSVGSLCTKLIRHSFIKDNGLCFDTDLGIGEDVVFLARLYTKSPSFTTLDRVIYRAIHHERADASSLTHTFTLKAFRWHIECRRRQIEICEAAGDTECKRYVYEDSSTYLDRFIMFIRDPEERQIAFEEYRQYLLLYDWDKKAELFRALFGIDLASFNNCTSDVYIQRKYDMLPRDRVLDEFAAGRIGLRWILKYFVCWLKGKLGIKK